MLTNWRREAESFTPELRVTEHYGPRRPSTPAELKKALKEVDLVLTSYGLLSGTASYWKPRTGRGW